MAFVDRLQELKTKVTTFSVCSQEHHKIQKKKKKKKIQAYNKTAKSAIIIFKRSNTNIPLCVFIMSHTHLE